MWNEPLIQIDKRWPRVETGWRHSDLLVAHQTASGAWHWQAVCLSAGQRAADATVPSMLSVDCREVAEPASTSVAIEFAEHLFCLRRSRRLVPGPVSLSVEKPAPTGHVLPMPHLLTVIDAHACTRDVVVWERFPRDRAVEWLAGAPDPDWAWLLAELPRILRLRGLLRAGQLGDTEEERTLVGLVERHFLSIRTVARNQSLVRRLLESSPSIPATTTPRDRGT
jgi:hypothetical protein